MTSKTTNLILLLTGIGVILGAVAGHYAPDLMLSLGFLGQYFLNALRLIVLPLIIAALIVGITSLGDVRKAARAVRPVLPNRPPKLMACWMIRPGKAHLGQNPSPTLRGHCSASPAYAPARR